MADYITAREFERFVNNIEARMGRIEEKVDKVLGRETIAAVVDSKEVAKKAAMHVSWITPLVLAIYEAIKAAVN
jgi:hypothetical protein